MEANIAPNRKTISVKRLIAAHLHLFGVRPLRCFARSAPLENAKDGDIYPDDGTNTASGRVGWRMFTAGVWKDMSAASTGSDSYSDADAIDAINHDSDHAKTAPHDFGTF